ncbi:hypothetical protein AX758_07730 [Enterococcus mundtii]|nr:hypothetical protein AX758_07730 [Enterococcus mundtii]
MYQQIDEKYCYSLLLKAVILQKSIFNNQKIEVGRQLLISINKVISIKIIGIFMDVALFAWKLSPQQFVYPLVKTLRDLCVHLINLFVNHELGKKVILFHIDSYFKVARWFK